MSWIICLAYFLLLFLIRKGVKDKISKYLMFVYVTYWCISLFLSSTFSFNLYPVDNNSYYLLLGHLFAFMLGFIMLRPPKKTLFVARDTNISMSQIKNSLFFWILFVSCFVFVLNLFIRQSELLLLYSLSDVRGDFVEMVLEGSGLLFYSIIATGMFHFCLCLSFYMLFFERRWVLIIPFLSYSLLFAFLGGGRHQFIMFVYYALGFLILKDYIASSIYRKRTQYKIPPKIKWILIVVFIISVVVMSAFTSLRSNESYDNDEFATNGIVSLGNTIVSYSTGPFVAFEKGINSPKYRKERYFGSATFAGTDRLLNAILFRYVSPGYKSSYEKLTQEIQHERIYIGPEKSWNYAYTSCFLYYCDFGLIGIILFPFILGIATRLLINSMEQHLTIYGIALYIFISFIFYDSVFSCYLHKQVSVVYITILLVLSKWNSIIGFGKHYIKK